MKHTCHHTFKLNFFIVPHLSGVICGTGVSQFIAKWALHVQTSMLARNIPHLDQYTPAQLQFLYQELNLPKNMTSSICHIGYDHDLRKFRAFVYRSGNDFLSEELAFGPYIRPTVASFSFTGNLIDDFKNIISIQREEDLALPLSERIGIGGEVNILILEQERHTIICSHRFDDYDVLYEQMCDALPANQNN